MGPRLKKASAESQKMSPALHRARTQDQKHFRRQQWMRETHFEAVGYESFSMANLAKLAGVAKGTLYSVSQPRRSVFGLYGQPFAGAMSSSTACTLR